MVNTLNDLSIYVSNVLRKHPAVEKAEVFGSFARGDQTLKSDVDIILTKKQNSILGLEFYSIADEIEEAIGRRVDLLTPATVFELVYKDRILKEARCIYES
jgi:predicted nucleotidyltransferase